MIRGVTYRGVIRGGSLIEDDQGGSLIQGDQGVSLIEGDQGGVTYRG